MLSLPEVEEQHDLCNLQEQGGTTFLKGRLIVLNPSKRAAIPKRHLTRGSLPCCPSVLLVMAGLIKDRPICSRISLKTLMMELFVPCVCDERNSEALPVLPSAEEYSMLLSNAKGKLPDSLRVVAPQRFVTSSLVQTLTYIDNFLLSTPRSSSTSARSSSLEKREEAPCAC